MRIGMVLLLFVTIAVGIGFLVTLYKLKQMQSTHTTDGKNTTIDGKNAATDVIGRKAVLSMLQTHYLCNALVSIQYYCESGENEKASEAAGRFGSYLRGNIDAIRCENGILFSKELENTKNYIRLEQLRYGERVKAEYDIATNDFYMPPLGLQSLVENAVRYGITQKEDGGVVAICVKETELYWKIVVSDNGVDYSNREKSVYMESHLSVEKLESVYREFCDGILIAQDRAGGGTEVVVMIPKNKVEQKEKACDFFGKGSNFFCNIRKSQGLY